MIKEWLSKCTDTHGRCSTQPHGERLPRRLLDVDPDSRIQALLKDSENFQHLTVEAEPNVRLCSTNSLSPSTQFLTLSHRWDTLNSARLTNENLTLLPKGIPKRLLLRREAKTFQDAIQVTRCLGYRYLWIDALCINQDDDSEKATEIGRMGQIYASGVAKISATGAAQAADGLFFERSLMLVNPCRKRIRQPSKSTETFVDLVAYGFNDWDDHINFEPLNQRAWVYQERMLAPRIIHFARERIFWECLTLSASECSHDGRLDIKLAFPKSEIAIDSHLPTIDNDRLSGEEAWSNIVYHYSPLSLTLRRDRLPAISALASRVCLLRAMESKDYLAGHWRIDFPRNLVWYVVRGTRPLCFDHSNQDYVAPSWSWASIEGGVRLFSYKTPIATLVNASVTRTYDSFFGEISSGYLRLRCSVCRILWHPKSMIMEVDDPRGNIWKQKVKLYEQWRYEVQKSHISLRWDSELFSNGIASNKCWMPLSVGQLRLTHSEYHLVPILQSNLYGGKNGRTESEGLILYRTPHRGQYVRVGVFMMTVMSPDRTVDDAATSHEADGQVSLSNESNAEVSGAVETNEYNDLNHITNRVKDMDMKSDVKVSFNPGNSVPRIVIHGPEDDDRRAEDNQEVNRGSYGYDVCEVILHDPPRLDEEDYLEVTEDGKYIIEIV